ncbi:hypothetical protein JCM33374_g6537 [Metschnikowia sp. JCM 33374]|nr:hypothetical protein JCM33374_g6537 [Metschnikowia sp. JCM 33374]
MDRDNTNEANDLVESTISEVRHELLESYPNIAQFMSTFSVSLDPIHMHINTENRRFKDSIFVFKKKKLSSQAFENNTDIYANGLRGLELDISNQNKSRSSCERCRRYKKKCTRDLPECLNCSISEELCVYKPRKKRCFSQNSISLDSQGTEISETTVDPTSSSYLIEGQSNQSSMTEDMTSPRGGALKTEVNSDKGKLEGISRHEEKGSSDLMKLLN